MGYTDSAVIVLGIIVLVLGLVTVGGYYDAQDRAQKVSQQGLFGGLEAIGIMIQWMTNAFQFLILNLFVTGIALITSGIGLRRINELQTEAESASGAHDISESR